MKRLILLILLIFNLNNISGQDMKTLFINIPDSYIAQLEQAWRKDLVDLYLSGKEARLRNTMEGTSQLLNLTENYLMLRSTERTVIEIKRLPLINNTYIICMVYTIEGPAPDSQIEFYTTEWQPLDRKSLFTPVSREWFFKEDADRLSDRFLDAMALLDMDLITYSLNPDNDNLTATYSTPLYLEKTQRQKVTEYIKSENKVYIWDKSRYSN